MESGSGSPDPLEIRVENLHKSFGSNRVLRGVNLSVQRGEMIAIVGGSGCGKTVLMEHLIGQMRPDEGHVWLADHESPDSGLVDLSKLNDAGMDRLRIHWAVVFQGNGLISGTVEYNISLPLEWVKGLDESEIRQRTRRAIEAVGLNADEILGKTRDELSGGMAKRIAIARALALDPLLIFYDEPTTGLDPENTELIQDLIFKMHQRGSGELRRTSLIITHDKDLLRRLQPRVAMLNEGQVFFDGSYTAFQKSDSPVIRPYFELMPILQQRPVSPLGLGMQ
jgi:phospholipid/cholesterol/gamma-HCH transport system ATP-binding protein